MYMESFHFFVMTLQSMGISLGVGASTIAVLQFFTAIKDGVIDEHERNMMGMVYIVLRVAMSTIFIAALVSGVILIAYTGMAYFIAPAFVLWTLVGVLFANAYLMTIHVMPSTFGPAIQASSWYSLGIFTSLYQRGLDVTYGQFLLCYIALFLLAVAIINGVMAYFRAQSNQKTS